MTITTEPTTDLHPGSRLLFLVLRNLAAGDDSVTISSADLLAATGWKNRMSLRRHAHHLEDAGLLEIIPGVREDGGAGPNTYRLKGDI